MHEGLNERLNHALSHETLIFEDSASPEKIEFKEELGRSGDASSSMPLSFGAENERNFPKKEMTGIEEAPIKGIEGRSVQQFHGSIFFFFLMNCSLILEP